MLAAAREDFARCSRSGKRWRCKNPAHILGGYCEHCLEVRRARNDDSGRTPVGLARRLRSQHGYERNEAMVLAEVILAAAACELCALPARVMQLLWEVGGPFAAKPVRNNFRFTADRIDVARPHTIANTRVVCWPCNHYRNRDRMSDDAVRAVVHRWWRQEGPAELRGWLDGRPVTDTALVEAW